MLARPFPCYFIAQFRRLLVRTIYIYFACNQGAQWACFHTLKLCMHSSIQTIPLILIDTCKYSKSGATSLGMGAFDNLFRLSIFVAIFNLASESPLYFVIFFYRILLRDLDQVTVMVHVLRERLVEYLSMFEEVAVTVLDLCAKV